MIASEWRSPPHSESGFLAMARDDAIAQRLSRRLCIQESGRRPFIETQQRAGRDLLVSRGGLVALDCSYRCERMNVDFSGKWTAQLESDPLLPGIEFGTLVVTIDHIEPLLQLAAIASAPHYSLGHFVLNYRTDGTEIVTSIHGIRFRTNARWDNAELAIQTEIAMGSFSKGLRSRWALSKDGTVLTIRHLEGESEIHVTVLHRQVPPLREPSECRSEQRPKAFA